MSLSGAPAFSLHRFSASHNPHKSCNVFSYSPPFPPSSTPAFLPPIQNLPAVIHRQFRARGAKVEDGAFGENLVVEGIDFKTLPIGTKFKCNDVVLELTQIGKECHHGCAIFQAMGDCIMPREGVFTKVLHGGVIKEGDNLEILEEA